MIAIRSKRNEDSARLLEIWRRAVDATHSFLAPEDRAAIEPLVADYLRGGAFLVAADEQERPVGFLGATGTNIDSLFVDPDMHGRGVGRALVEHIGGTMTVDVNEQNVGAVEFYQRLGFAVVGRSSLDDQGRPYPLLHMARG